MNSPHPFDDDLDDWTSPPPKRGCLVPELFVFAFVLVVLMAFAYAGAPSR